MSLPEVLLWRELRKRPDGLKWRHQHPAGPYVIDFYCPEVDLAVEIDGQAHGHGDRPERDAIRDEWLRLRDVRVLRINASDVLNDLDGAILHITTTARG